MRHLPRSLGLVGRLAMSVVWLVGLVGPLPAAPALAQSAAPAVPAGPGLSNDAFENATVVTLPPTFYASVDLSLATSQSPAEPYACLPADTPSVWYTLTPPETGLFAVEIDSTTITPTVAIYSGSGLGDLHTVDCSSGSVGYTSLTTALSANVTYYIQVAGELPDIQAGTTIEVWIGSVGRLHGLVWNDADGDGAQDAGETPLPGATVSLLDSGDNIIAFVNTDASGNYVLSSLPVSETFSLVFTAPPLGDWYGSPLDATSDANDSDADPWTGQTISFTLSSLTDLDFDAGFGAPAEISGTAWRDLNSNNAQDPGEPGLKETGICLISEVTVTVAGPIICADTAFTDADGNYAFKAPPGSYSVGFDNISPAFNFATANVGSDATDSDADAAGLVPTFTVTLGEVVDFDAGYQTTGVGDRVWRDFSADGDQDVNEPGVEGVQVDLYDTNGLTETTYTDVNGEYAFYGLPAGDYALQYTLPTGNTFAPQDQGDDTLDSDADVSTGRTVTFTLTAGQLDLTWDAGLVKPFLFVDNLNEYSDTTLGDALCNDTTSVASGIYGECSLRAAIEEANANPDFDVIQFDGTVFSVTQTILQSLAYTLTTSLWVDAAGSYQIVLNGNNVTRIFQIQDKYGADVRLTGLTLDNAYLAGGYGGAIRNESANLWLAEIAISGAYAEYGGAGLYNEYAATLDTVSIRDSNAGSGAGIYNIGTLNAILLTLENNVAYGGGGLYNEGLAIVATSTISGNVATEGDGGGVLNAGAFTASDTYIIYNSAVWDGGGVASDVLKRAAGAAAEPAICQSCGPEYATAVTLTANTEVAYNLAGNSDQEPAYGGGVYNGYGQLTVDGSRIFSNTVYGDGGGVYNGGLIYDQATSALGGCGYYNYCAPVTVITNSSQLYYNTAISTTVIDESGPYTYTYAGRGGGLFNLGLTESFNSTLHHNTANQGGGFFNDVLEDCFCQSLISGPFEPQIAAWNTGVNQNQAIAEPGANLSLFNTGNSEPFGLGGGGYNSGLAEFTDSTIESNVARVMGGGLYNGISDIAFAASTAATPAGILLASLPDLRVHSTSVSGNTADPLDDGEVYGAGGGIFNLLGSVDVDGSTIAYNDASLWGGGIANGCFLCFFTAGDQAASLAPQGPAIFIFFLFTQLHVYNGSQIIYNAANPLDGVASVSVDGGGGIFNGGLAVIEDSSVMSNTALTADANSLAGLGGGIFNLMFLTVDNTTVAGNAATSLGGGIYNLFYPGVALSSADLAPAGPSTFFGFPPDLSIEAGLVLRNNTSVSGNYANPGFITDTLGYGGGVATYGPTIIVDSSVSDNRAAADGGGLAVGYGVEGQQGLAAQAPSCAQGFLGLFGLTTDRVLVNNSQINANAAGYLDGKNDPQGSGGGASVIGSYPCYTLPLEANHTEIDGNTASVDGGGVFVDGGEVYLHNVNLTNNQADSDEDFQGSGGATYNSGGYLLIDPSNVTGNAAPFGAGGYYDSGTTVITQTTFATNTATTFGGALMIAGTAQVLVGNSTFSANSAGSGGGAFYQSGADAALTLVNVTVAYNGVNVPGQSTASGAAGGAYFRNGTGPAVISNTIIAHNDAILTDCYFNDTTTNISGIANLGDSSCNFLPDWTSADPLLDPLAYNGGPNSILTHALQALSPAIDQADTGACAAAPINGVDERDLPRLLDLLCDIGAYEFETETVVELVTFTAVEQGGQVQLAWETAAELDTAGFNLYRAASANGPYTQVNALLIAAQGPQGGQYTAQDNPGAGTWYYRLEDVDTHGAGTFHGPVAVTVGSSTAAAIRLYLPLVQR